MSLYTRRKDVPPDGPASDTVIRAPDALPRTARSPDGSLAGGPATAQDWAARRRAQPANFLLPASIRWFAELPAPQRPVALAARYPRIINQLALTWNSPSATRARFDELLTDHRGGRLGFPPAVQRELLALRNHYSSTFLTLED